MPHPVLIFDFDGVLADTRDDILRFAEMACAELGCPCQASAEDLDVLEHMSFDKLARQLNIPEEKVELFVKRSFELFNARHHPPDVVSGISDVVAQLAASCKIGIVTGNNRETVHAFLVYHCLEACFDIVLDADVPGSRADKILMVADRLGQPGSEIFMIGDAVSDIRAARQASIKCIAVTWGHQSCARLEAQGPDFIVHSPKELLTVLGGAT
jgi:phosphoglycolate phosphatase-like HAD superfamily hydrolase